MVRPIVTATAALLTVLTGARADIDLTPIDSYYVVEGFRSPNLNFHDDGKVISYSPPPRWKPGGTGKKATLLPPDMPQASASIEALPANDPLPATDQNLKAYSDFAVKLLPREASKVEVTEAIISSFRVCGYAMAQVTVTYTFFGQEYKTVTFFMPRLKEQIRFQLSCRTADFKTIYRPFERSLFSIQGF